MQQIEIWAWLATDSKGVEGVPGYTSETPEGEKAISPMMGAGPSMKQAEEFFPLAKQIAQRTGRPVRLVRATGYETVETIEPEPEPEEQ